MDKISQEDLFQAQLLTEKLEHANTSVSLATQIYNNKVLELKLFWANIKNKYNIDDNHAIDQDGNIIDANQSQ